MLALGVLALAAGCRGPQFESVDEKPDAFIGNRAVIDKPPSSNGRTVPDDTWTANEGAATAHTESLAARTRSASDQSAIDGDLNGGDREAGRNNLDQAEAYDRRVLKQQPDDTMVASFRPATAPGDEPAAVLAISPVDQNAWSSAPLEPASQPGVEFVERRSPSERANRKASGVAAPAPSTVFLPGRVLDSRNDDVFAAIGREADDIAQPGDATAAASPPAPNRPPARGPAGIPGPVMHAPPNTNPLESMPLWPAPGATSKPGGPTMQAWSSVGYRDVPGTGSRLDGSFYEPPPTYPRSDAAGVVPASGAAGQPRGSTVRDASGEYEAAICSEHAACNTGRTPSIVPVGIQSAPAGVRTRPVSTPSPSLTDAFETSNDVSVPDWPLRNRRGGSTGAGEADRATGSIPTE